MTPDSIAAIELVDASGNVLVHAAEGTEFNAPAGTAWLAAVSRVRWINATGETVADVPVRWPPAEDGCQ